MRRKILLAPALESIPVSALAPDQSRERAAVPTFSTERAPVPKFSPEWAPVPMSSPEKAPSPALRGPLLLRLAHGGPQNPKFPPRNFSRGGYRP